MSEKFLNVKINQEKGYLKIINNFYSCNNNFKDNIYSDCKINLECFGDSNCFNDIQLIKRLHLDVLGNEHKKLSFGELHGDKKIEIYPGEYEVIIVGQDREITRQCQSVITDGFQFNEFNGGLQLSKFKNSILCFYLNDGCYGILEARENKLCEITGILIRI